MGKLVWVRMKRGPLKGKPIQMLEHLADADVQSGFAELVDPAENVAEGAEDEAEEVAHTDAERCAPAGAPEPSADEPDPVVGTAEAVADPAQAASEGGACDPGPSEASDQPVATAAPAGGGDSATVGGEGLLVPAVAESPAEVGGDGLPADFPHRDDLVSAGLSTRAAVRAKSRAELVALRGIGPAGARRVIAAAGQGD
jgi:hypothetical protein